MQKAELTASQLRDVKIFNLMMEHHGWEDLEGVEKAFDEGEEMCPEGERIYLNQTTVLQVSLHLPINMLSLRIEDLYSPAYRQLHFLYDHKPDEFLCWLGTVSEEMNLEDYPHYLMQVFDYKGLLLLELPDGSLVDLQPGKKEAELWESVYNVN